jgi:hypothetical protein
MNRIERISLGIVIAGLATPAFAGIVVVPVPAPIAGVGIGAVVLLGLGYRALKSRIGR